MLKYPIEGIVEKAGQGRKKSVLLPGEFSIKVFRLSTYDNIDSKSHISLYAMSLEYLITLTRELMLCKQDFETSKILLTVIIKIALKNK
ncbi:hypothetical protein [Methanolobus sp.]|uniref:hypothetical protein n=1 Tax=Methanolobus sp. TaxID=1874737 RepID=UPI0025EBE656|nr:hypothetical protein [Methanolobus sp.]